MGAIQARFFHYHKGELSGDVLADGDGYSGWNTVIGEGASGEPADDLLVLVPLTAAGEVFSDTPLGSASPARRARCWASGGSTAS